MTAWSATVPVCLRVAALLLTTAVGASASDTITPLVPIVSAGPTGQKPQSKVWEAHGSWWAVLASAAPSGTWLWQLDEPSGSWSNVLQLSTAADTSADCLVTATGDLVHVLLHGSSPELVSIEFESATSSYVPWTLRPVSTPISLPDSETATIALDSTGTLWLATEQNTSVLVYHSDSPYTLIAGPVTLASDITTDDIATVAALPDSSVGVLWSNQSTERFGFRVHADGAAPTAWSADEVPASQSAQAVGGGMADDHLNVAVATDGTLFAAVKTSFDQAGMPRVALLVRRPTGLWDSLYEVDQTGTRPVVLLNETDGTLRVAYTQGNVSGDIVARRSSIATIGFGAETTLLSGALNDVSSVADPWTTEVVLLASDGTGVLGVLLDAHDPWDDLGNGLAGSVGVPALLGTGTLIDNTPVGLRLSNALPSTLGFLVMGVATLNVPFKGGVLVPDITPPGLFVPIPIGPTGSVLLSSTWPAGIPTGFVLYAQWWLQDGGSPSGFAASNAVAGTTP